MLRFILEIEVHVSGVIESNGENYVQEMESVLFAMILIIANWGLFETTKLQWAL